MKHKLEKRMRQALKTPVPISEERLEAAKKAAVSLYNDRSPQQKISFPAFLFAQIRFCGVWVWLLQGGALFALFLILNSVLGGDVSAIKPHHLPGLLSLCAVVVAATSLPGISRSWQYRMYETEAATRLSLPGLILCRLLILGLVDFFILAAAFSAALWQTSLSGLNAAVYLLLPFLAACFGSLLIIRHAPGERLLFFCTLFCGVLFLALWLAGSLDSGFYQQTGLLAALTLLCGAAVYTQCRKLVRDYNIE
ncbi:hypothetical protein [Eubacterium sp. 1001713B170207_170306_E7]|uniref:hypothetical protein n=1 Tax=Eubacterium sp. 1001713B170207_170306_E7 TaxID=2787097 RepID=UPI00189C497A|nr:hypothetical protein [Eubacterium sp. 1001713B170207_170306_E7]